MKQIGLQKLDVVFKCCFDTQREYGKSDKYLQAINGNYSVSNRVQQRLNAAKGFGVTEYWNMNAPDIFAERATYWVELDDRCRTEIQCGDTKYYTVKLSRTQ